MKTTLVQLGVVLSVVAVLLLLANEYSKSSSLETKSAVSVPAPGIASRTNR
jgi:hypothetical protein